MTGEEPVPGGRSNRLLLAFDAEGAPPVVTAVPDDGLGARAAGFYPDYRTDPPEDADPGLTLSRDGDAFRVEGAGAPRRAASEGEALALWEIGLTNLLAGRIDGALRLHAGAVAGGRGALLLSGPPETGKSTLTAALARRGHPVFGDDIVLLRRESGFLQPFKRLLKLTEPGLGRLGLPSGAGPAGELWPHHSLFHPADLGAGWADPLPVTGVVFPRRREGPTVERSLVGGGDAVRRLLDQTLYADAAVTRRDFMALTAAVTDARFHELAMGDLSAAGDTVERLLE